MLRCLCLACSWVLSGPKQVSYPGMAQFRLGRTCLFPYQRGRFWLALKLVSPQQHAQHVKLIHAKLGNVHTSLSCRMFSKQALSYLQVFLVLKTRISSVCPSPHSYLQEKNSKCRPGLALCENIPGSVWPSGSAIASLNRMMQTAVIQLLPEGACWIIPHAMPCAK